MWTRASTFLVWALAAGSIAFWGLKLAASGNPPPANVQLASASGPPRGDLSRLLGADAPPEAPAEAPVAAPDPRFRLVGVVSPRAPAASGQGLAVIVVDDKPARAYRIGAVVDGDTVLQSVNARGASLGPRGGAVVVALDLPPPAAAATGSLPAPFAAPSAVPFAAPLVAPGAVPRPGLPVNAWRPPVPPQPRQPSVQPAAPQMGPQPNLPSDEQTVAPVIPRLPGQPPGFNQAGGSKF